LVLNTGQRNLPTIYAHMTKNLEEKASQKFRERMGSFIKNL